MAIRSHALVAAATFLCVSLGFSAPAPDPVLGSWLGELVFVVHQNQNGTVSDQATTSPNVTIDYNPNHLAVWIGDYTGPWSKTNGKYRIKLSTSLKQHLQDGAPTATIKKAKFNIFDVVVTGDAQITAVKTNQWIVDGADFLKAKQTGTICLNLVP